MSLNKFLNDIIHNTSENKPRSQTNPTRKESKICLGTKYIVKTKEDRVNTIPIGKSKHKDNIMLN